MSRFEVSNSKQIASVNALLAAKANQTDLNTTNANVSANAASLAEIMLSVKSYGAKGDGVTDDTTAINNAVSALVSLQKTFANLNDGSYTQNFIPILYFPPGDYIYKGTINSLSRASIKGAGKGATRIQLTNNQFFFEPPTLLHSFELKGITFSGGKGIVHHTTTGSNDRGNYIVEDCEFYNYSVCAIGSNSSDMPYWKIKNNRFFGTNTSIGIALPQVCDFGVVEENEFLLNQYHIKMKQIDGGYIAKNDFIRWNSGVGTTDIWIVPTTVGGRNTAIYNNKFGNENLGASDYRILIAQEATSTNDYCSNNTPDLVNVDLTNKISSFTVTNNAFNGVGNITVPLIYSMCMGIEDMYFDNDIRVGMPTCIIDFPQEQTEWNRLNRSNYFRLKNADEQSELLMCPVSLKTGIGKVDDPHSFMAGRMDVPNYYNGGNSSGINVLLYPSDLKTKGSSASGSSTNYTDSLGDTNALEVFGNFIYQFNIGASSVTTGKATWIEIDTKQALSYQLTYIELWIVDNSDWTKVSFKKKIWLNSKWNRQRFLWIPRPTGGDGYNLQIRPGDYINGSKQNADIGRIFLYQSNEPVTGGNLYGHSLQMEVVSQGITNNGHTGQLYYDGNNINMMSASGAVNTLHMNLSGATSARPTVGLYIGMPYYDTTLNKPVWCKTVSPAAWVDATGTSV